MSENEKIQLTKAELLLYLDVLAYFPEFSHRRYDTVGDFITEYLGLPRNKRPVTMFSGFCGDKRSGVTALMERAAKLERITRLPIIYSSVGTGKFTSLCTAEDTFLPDGTISRREIYVIIGCNYRFGEYLSDFGKTSTWSDNFLGAALSDTAEQKSILRFYDEAVEAALEDPRITAGTEITITVSGHSKAGNLAQYIAVMRDNAGLCVSFDGQGFSKKFLRKYREHIRKHGGRIVNICPDVSIAGSLLRPVPNAKNVYIQTGHMREKGTHLNPLYYHIPVSVLNADGRMRPFTKKKIYVSPILHRISVSSVDLAVRTPFINEKRGLDGIGKAVMHFFKGRYRKALSSLLNKDSLLMIAAAMIMTGVLLPSETAGKLIYSEKAKRR